MSELEKKLRNTNIKKNIYTSYCGLHNLLGDSEKLYKEVSKFNLRSMVPFPKIFKKTDYKSYLQKSKEILATADSILISIEGMRRNELSSVDDKFTEMLEEYCKSVRESLDKLCNVMNVLEKISQGSSGRSKIKFGTFKELTKSYELSHKKTIFIRERIETLFNHWLKVFKYDLEMEEKAENSKKSESSDDI